MFFPNPNGSQSVKPDKASAPARRFSFAAIFFALIAVYGIVALTSGFKPQQEHSSELKILSQDQKSTTPSNLNAVDENTDSSNKDDESITGKPEETQSHVLSNTDNTPPSEMSSPEPQFRRSQSVNYLGYAVKVILITALLLGAFWGVAKWMKNKRGLGGHSAIPMDVLGRQYLGPKQSITAVKVGDRVMLLGVTESSVQMLTELDEDIPASVQNNSQSATESGQYFSDLIHRLTRNTDPKEMPQVHG